MDAARRRVQQRAAFAEQKGYASQAAVMRDGTVTFAELRQARLDAFACMERQGLSVSSFKTIDTPFGYDTSQIIAYNGKPQAAGQKISNDCEVRYDLGVLAGYGDSHPYFTPKARAFLKACLAKTGKDLGAARTLDEATQIVGSGLTVARCLPPVVG